MSSGPEHYKEAERLLSVAQNASPGVDVDFALRASQIHATLALAAATAYPAVRDWIGDEARDGRDWLAVTA